MKADGLMGTDRLIEIWVRISQNEVYIKNAVRKPITLEANF